jgi:hypothetical protein
MDPVGATASIITIVQVSSGIVKYIVGVKGSAKERQRLHGEILACEAILLQLRDRSEDPGEEWLHKIKVLEGADGPLHRLEIALNAVKKKLELRTGWDRVKTGLKWPFDEKELGKLLATIQRERSLLQLALTDECR